MRTVFILLLVLCGTSLAADRYSSAEIQVGFATSTGFSTFADIEGDRVAPGSVGTTLLFTGYFPTFSTFTISPGFTLLTTDGRVTEDPTPPPAFDIRFHQREVGVDALWSPGNLRKLNFGIGSSFAWWSAAEDNARPPIDGEYLRGRSIEGKALMARGVAHLALRNPDVSGAAIKLVAAWPLTDLLSIDNTAATGYIGLHCGFSMILN